mmetsp:Transcript_12003/g.19385  ORF Transcript_12003/g.19385 Transcript_12003/m.19385 type:complete len:106 (+) Transcript_12003:212-529(+)
MEFYVASGVDQILGQAALMGAGVAWYLNQQRQAKLARESTSLRHTCHSCEGTGEVKCDACSGRRKGLRCESCSGRGFSKCSRCGGGGQTVSSLAPVRVRSSYNRR